ncbi:tRNA (adenine(22)-N(1))-methyltransferase [Shewanella sp. 125m-7]
MKLSTRLQYINSLINTQYEHIWDCCCDHGLLGAALLKRNAASNIHFVDVVPSLMAEVKSKLQRFHPNSDREKRQTSTNTRSHWQVHCLDVAKLNLAEKEQRQLIIIAGVGGELTIELVRQIISRHPQHSLEFILCPVHHIYQVRTEMQKLSLGLVSEHLMQENKRFYEILHLSTDSHRAISPVGSMMWDHSRELDNAYLQSTLKHYQRMALGLEKANLTIEQLHEKTDVEQIIADYRALTAQ